MEFLQNYHIKSCCFIPWPWVLVVCDMCWLVRYEYSPQTASTNHSLPSSILLHDVKSQVSVLSVRRLLIYFGPWVKQEVACNENRRQSRCHFKLGGTQIQYAVYFSGKWRCIRCTRGQRRAASWKWRVLLTKTWRECIAAYLCKFYVHRRTSYQIDLHIIR